MVCGMFLLGLFSYVCIIWLKVIVRFWVMIEVFKLEILILVVISIYFWECIVS